MPCSRKEALVKLFYYVTTIVKFFFLFFYLFSLFFAKLFLYFLRFEDEYEDEMLYEDEDEDEDENIPPLEEEEEEEYRYSSNVEARDHLVADILNDGEALVFLSEDLRDTQHNTQSHVHNSSSYESLYEEPVEVLNDEMLRFENSTTSSSEFEQEYSNDHIGHDDVDFEVITEPYTSTLDSEPADETSDEFIEEKSNKRMNNNTIQYDCQPMYKPQISPTIIEQKASGLEMNPETTYDHDPAGEKDEKKTDVVKEDLNFTKDEKFLIFAPPKSEARKTQVLEKENKEVIFEDTYTVGSTSKDSSEWRSSIRDSGTDEPFSSSSRRSCPKWESYAVYQKYDEEMMFLDRISAQKLHETESLRSFQVKPRSMSQRIVHKIANRKKRSSDDEIYKNNPYNELEVAYVAQICLTWEALNWNYANFQRKKNSKTGTLDPGCPAYIAQQFQQFQVLLQRYIENEPYGRGKRPEIYAKMRSVTPNLLQVPEYHDYEGDKELAGGRIASELFLKILEDGIQTFMNFLKADRENHCQIITAFFKGRQKRRSVDPSVINVVKKINKKKKLKLKDKIRTRKCFRKNDLTKEEEMEILMGLIDLKVVSRVLRMADLTQKQLHWCEEKMCKLRLFDGKFLRDSSTLFFPAH